MNPIFNDILDQTDVLDLLTCYFEKEEIPSSMLFYGPEGTGKFKTAIKFACLVTGQNYSKGTSLSPDILVINKDEESIKIEEIQELIRSLGLKPALSDKKVCIINNAENMTRESFNCLLKTLEEPPFSTSIILITSKPDNIPETVLSRCIKIKFKRLSTETLAEIIRINTGIEKQEAIEIARIADGSAKKALEISEPQKRKILLDLFKKTTSLWENKRVSAAECIRCAEEFEEKGYEARLIFRDLLDILILYWHDRLIERIDEKEYINKIIHIISLLFSMQKDLDINVNPHLAYSHILLEVRNILKEQGD